MAYDGSLIFNTKVDTNGFNKGTKSVTSSLTSFKGVLLSIGKVVGTAFGVKKLIEFGKTAIDTASDLQEVQNVVDTAFGTMSYKMEEFANNSIKQFGISRLAAKQTGSTFMAMANGMGLTQENASNMAIALTGLSADMASFYNVEQEVASTALKSIFTGETETLKQFGIVMTDTNLQAYALSQGIEKSTAEMSQAEKVQLRYNYVMSQTKLAQGDFAKTQDSWANQTRILSEQWKEFSGTLGNVLMNVLAPAVKFLNSLLSNLISIATEAGNALAKIFGFEMQSSSATADTAKSTTQIADNAKSTADSTKKTAKENERSLASFDKINKLDKTSNKSDSSGSGANSSNISSPYNSATNQTFSTSNYSKFANDVKKIFGNLKTWFDTNFKLDFTQIGSNFSSVFGSIKQIAIAVLPGIKTMLLSAVDAVSTLGTGMATVFVKRLNTLSLGLKKYFDENKINIINGINTISNNFTSTFNNLSTFFATIFGTMGASVDRMRETVSTAFSNLLTGITNVYLSIGTIISDALSVFTGNLATWAEENKIKIGEFFDSFQQLGADLMNLFGTVFNDIGKTMSSWWNKEGKPVWDNISKMFIGIGDTLMNLWNQWIYPVISYVIKWVQTLWTEHLQPLFSKLLSLFSKIGELISTLWNTWLKPVVDWLVKTLKPIVMTVVNTIGSVFKTVFGGISDVIGGIVDALGGVIDFLFGVFTGNWKKAWNGIKNFFKGIWNAIWSLFKIPVNLIIDGINLLWKGIYAVVKGIVDAIGGIAGAIGDMFGQDWHFSMPDKPPLIPKLATGTVVPANYGNFLATLGDNKREPEVVSPLSTMKQAFKEAMSESNFGGNQPIVIETNGDLDGIVSLLNLQIKKQDRLAGATI
mgnify:FL=1